MTSENPGLAKPNGFLEPLPTLNLVGSVEKLDAGLRSLDHCEYNCCYFGESISDVIKTGLGYHYGAILRDSDSFL